MNGKQKVVALVAEFLGTAILVTAVMAVMRSSLGLPYFIAIAVGLTVALLMLLFGHTSGSHLNPAVTLGLWTVRRIGTVDAITYIAAQFAGALGAWLLYTRLTEQSLSSLVTGGFDWRVLVAEGVGALVLAFGVAAALNKALDIGRRAVIVGLSYALGVIIASTVSYGFVNPAVALGLQSWSIAYVAGPIAGVLLGINLYNLLFASPAAVAVPGRKVAAAKSESAARGKRKK